MAVQFACPGCRSGFHIDDSLCGKTLRCSRCHKVFRIGFPAPRPAPVPVAPARPAPGRGRLAGPVGVLVLGAGLLLALWGRKGGEPPPPAATRPGTAEPDRPRRDALPTGALRRMPPLMEEAPELRAPRIEGDRAERLLPGTVTDLAV